MLNEQHNVPTVKTIDGMFLPNITIVDSSVAGTVTTYEGWASQGAKEDEAVWKIRRTVAVTAGSVVTSKRTYPDAKQDFNYKWSDRTSHVYA